VRFHLWWVRRTPRGDSPRSAEAAKLERGLGGEVRLAGKS
jgi:hypothetical protein